MRFNEFVDMPILEEIVITVDGSAAETIREGKWISGRFENNIRIDQPTHGVGQTHAHVLGRKGNEIGVVNLNGTASHGTKCKLSNADADALTARGFTIQPGNIVEWSQLSNQPRILLESSPRRYH